MYVVVVRLTLHFSTSTGMTISASQLSLQLQLLQTPWIIKIWTQSYMILICLSRARISAVIPRYSKRIEAFELRVRNLMPGVCMLAALRENYWTDFTNIFATYVYVVKEELIKLSKSCAFTSGIGSRNVLNDSSTSPDTAFFLAYISEESDRLKILSQMYPCTRKYPLNCGGNPNPDTDAGFRVQTIVSLADVCGLWLLLIIKMTILLILASPTTEKANKLIKQCRVADRQAKQPTWVMPLPHGCRRIIFGVPYLPMRSPCAAVTVGWWLCSIACWLLIHSSSSQCRCQNPVCR